MALPKAIQQQVEEADALVANMTGEKTEGEEVVNQAPTETEPQQVAPEPEVKPVEEPKQTVSQETTAPVPESKWENKYHTLKGMYDAEVPRLHAEMREMKAQLQKLAEERAELQAKAETPPEPQRSLITEQDKEAFGPDLIDLIERATESKLVDSRKREADLIKEIKDLKSQLGNVSERQVMSDKDRFLMGLSARVSDWEQYNTDPGFLEWLQQVDPVYGMPRQYGLNSAYEAFDVGRVATIFETYKALVTPKQAPQAPKQELQRQVAPTRSRSSTPPAADSQNQRFFSQQEIEQFYDEWRRGYIDNDEAVRMEKEIHAAISQNRIR
jgi:hypothetical protein